MSCLRHKNGRDQQSISGKVDIKVDEEHPSFLSHS